MKRLFSLILLIVPFLQVYAEGDEIIIDSLPVLYKQVGNIFKIIDTYNIRVYSKDEEKLFYNEELKNVLLKIFDENQYKEYQLDNFETDIKRLDTTKLIVRWFSHRLNHTDIDSILDNNELKNKYRDSAYVLEKKSMQESVLNLWNENRYFYKSQSYLVRSFKWQEFYDELYSLWEKDGKSPNSKWFYFMLDYQDPEAIAIVKNYCDSCINTKKINYDNVLHNYLSGAISRSYSFKLKVLKENFKVMGSYDMVPANLLAIEDLIYEDSISDPKIRTFVNSIRDEIDKKLLSSGNNGRLFSELSEKISNNADILYLYFMDKKQKSESTEPYWKKKLVYHSTYK